MCSAKISIQKSNYKSLFKELGIKCRYSISPAITDLIDENGNYILNRGFLLFADNLKQAKELAKNSIEHGYNNIIITDNL